MNPNNLAKTVRACRTCALRSRCKRPVPGVGKPTAKIMVVGQAPGWQEDRDGIPWIGDAGQFLTAALEFVGITHELWLTNLVKCYPGRQQGGDAEPPPYAIAACRPHLQAEYDMLQPELIVAVGAVAMRAFGIKGGVRINAGKVFSTSWGPVLVVQHPAGIIRRPEDATAFVTQLHAIHHPVYVVPPYEPT